MVGTEEILICYFNTGRNCAQKFFEELIKVALNYRYRHNTKSLVSVSGKDITEAIFCLSSNDSIKIYNKEINGQKLIELFVTSIYLKYLDAANPDKMIFISIPFSEESYDVAVYVTDQGNYSYIKDGNKCKLSKKHTAYYIQIKEEFNFNDYKNNFNLLKKGLNIKSLEKKSSGYQELVLIFMRDYREYNSGEALPFLEKNKNVGLISMPSLSQKEIPITNGKDGNKNIILDQNKYNFFLYSEKLTVHIKFDKPKYLIPE